MSVAVAEQLLSEAEYLTLERRAEVKSEFFEGEMFAMAGETRNPSLIGTNLARALGNVLEPRHYRQLGHYPNTLRLHVPQSFAEKPENRLRLIWKARN